MKDTTSLTEGSLVRAVWRLALPTLVAYAFMDAFNIVDMIFVGRLGPPAIAAVSICGILMGVIRMLAIGIRTGTVAMVSRFVGTGSTAEAEEVLGQSLVLSVFLALLVAVGGYFAAEPVIRGLGASDQVLSLGVSYFRIMCVGGITMFLLMALGGGVRGFGDAASPMRAMVLASIINIALDPFLIFGLGPFPELGVAGSAVATVTARGIGSIYLLAMLLSGKRGIRLGRSACDLRWTVMARITRIGFFSTIRSLAMNVSRLVLVRIIAAFGTAAVAAFGIGMRLRIFLLMFGFGLGDAAAVLVGQNLGAREPRRAERSAWIAAGFYAWFLAAMGLVFLLVPETVIGIFNTDPDVLEMGGSFLVVFTFSLLFVDLAIILGRAISGAGDTLAPMIITIVALLIVGIPLVWWFSRLWGVTGAWVAIAVSEGVQGLGMLLWFALGRWKKKEV